MSTSERIGTVLAFLLGATTALAQATEPPEPPGLELPPGVRVRVSTRTMPDFRTEEVLRLAGPAATLEMRGRLPKGVRVQGYLSRAAEGRLTIVPEGGDVFSPGEMTFSAAEVESVELGLERKRHWLEGLLLGAALGIAVGLADDVDGELCRLNDSVMCSRAEALAAEGVGFSVLGAAVGALVRTQRWTPVLLEALAPPPSRESRVATPPAVRLQFTVRF